MEKMMDRCGLFGMFDNNGFHTSHLIYYGLFSMQHRGMEAAGICVNDNQGNFSYVKDEGLVTEVFDEMKLEKLQGHAGIGHILRYDGSDARENAQRDPLHKRSYGCCFKRRIDEYRGDSP